MSLIYPIAGKLIIPCGGQWPIHGVLDSERVLAFNALGMFLCIGRACLRCIILIINSRNVSCFLNTAKLVQLNIERASNP